MAAITIQMINDLRAATNVGMMDCKRALQDTDGNMEEAIKILREKGLALQVKRADRESKQGIIAAAPGANGGYGMVELNCETDFVAKTDKFLDFAKVLANAVAAGDENVMETQAAELTAVVAATGENVKIRRCKYFALTGTGMVESYIHMGGKVGVLVEVGCTKPETVETPAFKQLVHDLCLQAAAAAPRYLKDSEVPAEEIESEKEVYRAQVEGKPANIIEGILKGKLKKHFAEVCLIDQAFVKEPKMSITDVIKATEKEVGDTIEVKRFARYQLGMA
ncbi:MAG: translation elongation factor Ts [bacterium]|nr:translation elongation factor Ts [bacterium]MDO5462585.1 translation elongation factor Ts [bacterium]